MRIGFTLKEPTRARLHMRDDVTGERVTLRLAPQLNESKMGTIRLIVETRPPKDAEGLAAFKKMVGQLTKLLSVRHAEILANGRQRSDQGSRRAPAYSTEITKAS